MRKFHLLWWAFMRQLYKAINILSGRYSWEVRAVTWYSWEVTWYSWEVTWYHELLCGIHEMLCGFVVYVSYRLPLWAWFKTKVTSFYSKHSKYTKSAIVFTQKLLHAYPFQVYSKYSINTPNQLSHVHTQKLLCVFQVYSKHTKSAIVFTCASWK